MMLKWLGEDAKVQPEETFSSLHNFILTLQKAHKYNIECDERDAKRARQEADKSRRGKAAGSVSAAPGGAPIKKEIGVSSELAAKLANRNQRTNLVDDVTSGMANGIRRRGDR